MKQIFLIFLSFVGGICASAQSLEECRQLARENYPEIRDYNLIEETKQYNLSNAARAWIPQITFSGQASYQSATPTYPEAFQTIMTENGIEMVGIRKDQYKIALDVTQNIWDGGQYKANCAIIEAEAEEQRRLNDVSLYEIQSRVDDIYFSILLLEEQTKQVKAMISMLESNLARMRTYFNNGVAMQSDVDTIEAELLSAEQRLTQIESSRINYRQILEIFIGQSLNSSDLERPEMPVVTNRTSARPEFALFDSQQNKLEKQKMALNASVMPKFSAFAQGYYGYPGMDMFKSMVSADWTLNAMIGVRMSWNIGAFYTLKNNMQKLNVAQKQIDIQRDVFLFNTELQTTQDDGNISRLQKTIKDDNRIVELRRNVRLAAESQLENGVIDSTDLLRKITDETAASLNRSIHQIELLQASYKLKNRLNL